MPTYEYECPVGHVTERIFPFNKEPYKTITCPAPSTCCGWRDGHACQMKAKKCQVYKVSVQGDLPTRKAF